MATGLDRENVYATLFAALSAQLLAPKGPFNTVSRRYWVEGRLPPESFPALYFSEAGETYFRSPALHLPLKAELTVHLYVFSALGLDQEAVAATEVNNLADAVDAAVTGLSPSAGSPTVGTNTLGGLVADAFLTGKMQDMIASGPSRYSRQIMEMVVVTTQQGWRI